MTNILKVSSMVYRSLIWAIEEIVGQLNQLLDKEGIMSSQ